MSEWRQTQAPCVLEFAGALTDLEELRILSTRWGFNLFQRLSDLSNAGTSIFRANVDGLAVISTGHCHVVYKLTDELLADLAALRTRNVNSDEAEEGDDDAG